MSNRIECVIRLCTTMHITCFDYKIESYSIKALVILSTKFLKKNKKTQCSNATYIVVIHTTYFSSKEGLY